MKQSHGSIEVGRLRLPTVLREIARALFEDDWIRRSTEDGTSFYYIAGAKAWRAEHEGGRSFTRESIARVAPLTPQQESVARAQVALPNPARFFVDRAARRLKKAGGDPAAVDALVAVCAGETSSWRLQPGALRCPAGSEAAAALGDLLHALEMFVGADDERTEADVRAEAGPATEKYYLQELSALYDGVVHRAGRLEPLPVADVHLNEASRCYLYGFFKAAVLLSGSAVEAALLDTVPEVERPPKDSGGRGFYPMLVDAAIRIGAFGREFKGQLPVLADAAKEVFRRRNGVAHEGDEPDSSEAFGVLSNAKLVVERLGCR